MKDDKARDRAIERLVASRLREELQDRAPGCPDAETLAAYVERRLTQGERATCENHLSACLQCQGFVAYWARLSEAEEPQKVPVARRVPEWLVSLSGFRWAWAGSALVALVIAGIWYTREFNPPYSPPPQNAPTTRPPSTPSAATEVAAQPREEVTTAPALPPGKKASRPRVARNEPVARESRPASISALQARGAPSTLDRLDEGGTGGENARRKEPSERAQLAARPPNAKPGESTAIEDKGRSGAALTLSAPSPAPARETAREKRSGVGLEDGLSRSSSRSSESAPMALALKSSAKPLSPGGVWRVGPRGLIQKADARGIWTTQPSGVQVDLLDISFPTSAVGWAVGRAGTILRSTDAGANWTKIPAPTTEDLVRVVARDESEAHVMTRDGQVLATNDGGNSWRALPSK